MLYHLRSLKSRFPHLLPKYLLQLPHTASYHLDHIVTPYVLTGQHRRSDRGKCIHTQRRQLVLKVFALQKLRKQSDQHIVGLTGIRAVAA